MNDVDDEKEDKKKWSNAQVSQAMHNHWCSPLADQCPVHPQAAIAPLSQPHTAPSTLIPCSRTETASTSFWYQRYFSIHYEFVSRKTHRSILDRIVQGTIYGSYREPSWTPQNTGCKGGNVCCKPTISTTIIKRSTVLKIQKYDQLLLKQGKFN